MILSIRKVDDLARHCMGLTKLRRIGARFVVFRASDVKDLQIEQESLPPPRPTVMPQDPAIVNVRGMY